MSGKESMQDIEIVVCIIIAGISCFVMGLCSGVVKTSKAFETGSCVLIEGKVFCE